MSAQTTIKKLREQVALQNEKIASMEHLLKFITKYLGVYNKDGLLSPYDVMQNVRAIYDANKVLKSEAEYATKKIAFWKTNFYLLLIAMGVISAILMLSTL